MIDILCLLDTLHGTVRHGRLHRFTIAGGSSAARNCEKTLRKHGVPIYGRALRPNNCRSFLVPHAQAKYAEYLVCSAGAQVTDKLLDPRNAGYAAPKTAWGVDAKGGLGGKIAKLLGV
jgi:hypothetical protein